MRFFFLVATIVAGLWVALNAFAQDAKCPATGQSEAVAQQSDAKAGCSKVGCCQKGASAASCMQSAKSSGCGSKAVAQVPAMSYLVGDKKFCCDKMAGEEAAKASAKVRFVVADKTYDDQGAALDAYATVLDEYLAQLTTVKFAVGDESVSCPMTAESLAKKAGKPVQFVVASYTFTEKEKAEKAAKQASEAASKLGMTLAVGEQKFACPLSAKECADKQGKKVEYAVGETRNCCPKAAKVELAKAKIEAANKAIAEVAGA